MSAFRLVGATCSAALLAAAFLSADEHGHKKGADHMDHHFDAKTSAKNFDAPSRDAWQKPGEVIAALGLKSGQSIADIGAGTGYFAVRLAKSNPGIQVYGADISKSMVEYLRERAKKENLANIEAVEAGAESPNLPKPVDAVLMVNTYHHIGNRPVYFRTLGKSLKPGGRIAIIDFRPESKMGPPKEFHFTADQIRGELKEAGFHQAAEHGFLPEQQFLIFAR